MVNPAQERLTGPQLRAARALLGITADDLADATQIDVKTIRRAEQVEGPVRMTRANMARVIEVLEKQGIVFLYSNGQGPGVRLRSSNKSRSP